MTATTANSPFNYLVAGNSGNANPTYMPFTINNGSASWNSANFTASVSGGDAETRPINLACNKIIKI